MIPDLTARGVLPPGIHDTTIEEIRSRFGKRNAIRRRLMKGVAAIAEKALAAGALGLYVNGSFVTDKEKPGDWDGVLVVPVGFHPGMGPGRLLRRSAEAATGVPRRPLHAVRGRQRGDRPLREGRVRT